MEKEQSTKQVKRIGIVAVLMFGTLIVSKEKNLILIPNKKQISGIDMNN
ncbi:hypothetical protein G6549_19565 [Bacillus sp. MM2020_1]|nr:hypothetical protein [Bacillus sp. MM2020_1]